jgi:hypothetical protein
MQRAVHMARRHYDRARNEEERERALRTLAVQTMPQGGNTRKLYEELVSIVGEDGFWKEHTAELLAARQLVINTDGRPVAQRIREQLQNQECYHEPVRFTNDLATAAEAEDPSLQSRVDLAPSYWENSWHTFVTEHAISIENEEIASVRPAILSRLVREHRL